MDIIAELETIMDRIRAAKPVPLSASAMINKQEILDMLEAVKQSAPEELKQARWVMRDREDLISQSQQKAEKMLRDAQSERDRLVAKTEIIAAANREADKIIEEAKGRAREIRMEAEDYVDAKLANFEVVLQKTLSAVVKGRESLRGRLDLQAKAEEEAEVEAAAPVAEGTTGNVRIRRT